MRNQNNEIADSLFAILKDCKFVEQLYKQTITENNEIAGLLNN